jgi:oligoribonuclease NrnB/cAMP/cGMP phosphodiesterase (DHH superfamily)
VFWKKYGNSIDYLPISHSEPPPNIENKNVYIADIAFDLDTVLELKKKNLSLTILDHHISNFKNLSHLDYYIYDNNLSGTGVCWRYLFKNKPMPLFLKCVQTRDIWTWNVENAKEILCVLDSLKFDFDIWNDFENKVINNYDEVLKSGKAIINYRTNLINIIKKNKYQIKMLGYDVPIINTPFCFKDEILNEFALEAPFSIGYNYDGTVYKVSLRSTDRGVDVSKIAKIYGGGGHRNASAFIIKDIKQINNIYYRMKKYFVK